MQALPQHILLAANEDPVGFILQIGGAVLGLIAVVVVGWFVIVRVRAWMQTSEDATAPFTLDDLRRLHRDGKLTDAEFQRAREAMIGAVRSQKSREAAKPGGAAIDPDLAEQIEAERRSKIGTEARINPSESRVRKLGESVHGETVIRRPNIPRRPPEDGTTKRAE